MKYGVRVISFANVGNHLHFQIKLTNRFTYKPFIRAVTSAIAMAITRRNRGTVGTNDGHAGVNVRLAGVNEGIAVGVKTKRFKFWDHRPFTRVVESFRGYLKLKDYVRINQLEGEGYHREVAREMIEVEKMLWGTG